MTKREFLAKLKESLENDLDSRSVQENLAYYSSYIEDETRRGRSEAEVLEELGDPWVIAQSVIGMAEQRTGAEEEYDRQEPRRGYWAEDAESRYSEDAHMHTYRIDTWWKRLLLILGIIGIVAIVFAVIGGLISLVAPIIVPVLVIILVIRLFQRRW